MAPAKLERTGGSAFGRRIKDLRRERGISQRSLAQLLGIDFTYLSKLENAKAEPPSEETVTRMATLLEVDSHELLGLAGKVPADLKRRAANDPIFAMLLRDLSLMTDDEVHVLRRRVRTKRTQGLGRGLNAEKTKART